VREAENVEGAGRFLHVIGGGNAEDVEGAGQLALEVSGEPEEEGALLGVLFGQDREVVIEGVEGLGEGERIAGKLGGFAAFEGGLEGFFAFGGVQEELPELFGGELAGERLRGEGGAKSGRVSPRSSSLRRILRARTAAYWT
jgi:hypothetical protein